MQLNIPINALKSTGNGFNTRGGTLTSSLYLSRNPQFPLEAATKSYIDTAVTSINAAAVDAGILSEERFPLFTGDVAKIIGGAQIALSETGVVPGSYAKINVDEKGRVKVAYSLSADDIPGLNWNKINSNVPTTVTGYGITDAVAKDGDTLTGFLNITEAPVQSLHASNKQYVDDLLAAVDTLKPGHLNLRPGSTPAGFFRCNGALLSKATYSALYAVIGDQYTATTHPGAGQPWKNQFQINTEQAVNITGWANDVNTLPVGLAFSAVVVTKSKVYLIGGWHSASSSPSSTIYSANIDADGNLGVWSNAGTLPAPMTGTAPIVIQNKLYLLGGVIGGGYSSAIYSTTINSDGTLGAWVNDSSLPATLGYGQVFITRNRVHYLGGRTGSYTASVYTAPINADGSLGVWTTGTSLPVALAACQVVVTRNRVYTLGGHNGSYLSTVYTATINSDGTLGTWSTATSLPGPLSMSQSYITKNRVYLFGGTIESVNYVNTVYTAPINADGTIGTWTTGNAVTAMSGGSLFAVKNKLYIAGGETAVDTYRDRVLKATITGGLNDYSAYYDGTITSVDPTLFALPDFQSKEQNSFKYFIKY